MKTIHKLQAQLYKWRMWKVKKGKEIEKQI